MTKFRLVPYLSLLCLSLSLFLAHSDLSAGVLFIHSAGERILDESTISISTRFYGTKLWNQLPSHFDVTEGTLDAVIIEEKALQDLDPRRLFAALTSDKNVPILIWGLSSRTDSQTLYTWSSGSLLGIEDIDHPLKIDTLSIGSIPTITKELSNQRIPLSVKRLSHFILSQEHRVDTILSAQSLTDSSPALTFVRVFLEDREVFLATSFEIDANGLGGNSLVRAFSKAAPMMIFLRYALQDKAWHPSGYYANFTVDDPWLRESYGHLNFRLLLREMELFNFHTTIAFIPWNYSRSQESVAGLFREYPHRFSISVHGNNHDGREFYKYRTSWTDLTPARPLIGQEDDIRQALARMDSFREITQIDYDRIMVFPHGIFPLRTLRLLKQYNFLSTVNSTNVPLDANQPNDPLFYLRPISLEFAGFPSVFRRSARSAPYENAINLFLGNPIFLYAHEDFFDEGPHAFNEIAKSLNEMKSQLIWTSLENIMTRWYLERVIDSKTNAILMFSNQVTIRNRDNVERIYSVRKSEDFTVPIRHVTVDGRPHLFTKDTNQLSLTLSIPAGKQQQISIEYEYRQPADSITLETSSLWVRLHRVLADFRDLSLSTGQLHSFTRLYYSTGLSRLGVKRLVILLAGVIAASLIGFFRIRKLLRNTTKSVY